MTSVRLEASWLARLQGEFAQPYMQSLRAFLKEEKLHHPVFPAGDHIFHALDSTAFDQVKVVILGQDPYHNPGQAHGLCFSVPPGVAPPPSLVNIFKEQERDLGIRQPGHGCLESWASQGVLLLNSVLTVRAHQAASHQGQGWEKFTDAIIAHLNRERDGLVFLLWGSQAQKKGQLLDRNRHLVLTAPHPSPLSAHRGFLGCGHFSRTNDWLAAHGQTPIHWQLPPLSP